MYWQVARVAPQDFWKFSLALFKNQGDYFDIPTSTMTPLEIRAKLAALAAEAIGADKTAQFSDLLALKSSANGGTAVTDDLKYTGASFPAGARMAQADAVSYPSQVLAAEQHSRLPDRPVGRPRRERDLEQLGRQRVVRVPSEEGHGMKSG